MGLNDFRLTFCREEFQNAKEGCRALVDYYAKTGTVKGILFCTNVQRALYDSKVWERFSDIDDPDPLMQNLKLLSRRS